MPACYIAGVTSNKLSNRLMINIQNNDGNQSTHVIYYFLSKRISDFVNPFICWMIFLIMTRPFWNFATDTFKLHDNQNDYADRICCLEKKKQHSTAIEHSKHYPELACVWWKMNEWMDGFYYLVLFQLIFQMHCDAIDKPCVGCFSQNEI